MDRNEFIGGLRALADQYEANGKLPIPTYGIVIDIDGTEWRKSTKEGAADWEREIDPDKSKSAVKRIMRAMGRGRKDKKFNEYEFSCVKDFGGGVKLKVSTQREAVCKKVPTGNQIIHEAHTYTTARRVEDEYEWVCDDPVLAAKED